VWSLSNEQVGIEQLVVFLQSVVSICTDMGTELGLAEVCNIDLRAWLAMDGKEVLVVEDDSGTFCEQPPTSGANDFLFTYTMVVTGVLHIVHNLLKALGPKVLLNWVIHLKALKLLNIFSTRAWMIERFVERCLRGTHGAEYSHLFARSFPAIADWRFLVVQDFLEVVLPLWPNLQTYWDPVKYARHSGGERRDKKDEDDEDPVDLDELTTVIKAATHWSYWKMVFRLQALADKLCSFAERCPCHPPQPQAESALDRGYYRQIRSYPKQVVTSYGVKCICPLGGKMAMYFATGKVFETFEEMADTSAAEIAIDCGSTMSDGDRDDIVLDFERGRAYLQSGYRVSHHGSCI
jgi:hypothetical protein